MTINVNVKCDFLKNCVPILKFETNKFFCDQVSPNYVTNFPFFLHLIDKIQKNHVAYLFIICIV